MISVVPLSKIAKTSLGYKSLQNDFFYVNSATISTYGIEERFLAPILRFKNLSGTKYYQDVEPDTWIFNCKTTEGDLRGTGALRYIQSMADRPAAEKKQKVRRNETIRDVLSRQGGGRWYFPKATPHPAKLWIRKAFGSTYSPFIFRDPMVVDQRCNYLEPLDTVTLEELAAVVTSTLFSYSLEINGSASMGAGALEAATTKLRGYPVIDPRTMEGPQRQRLVELGHAVWEDEAPIDWLAHHEAAPQLRALDTWLLALSGSEIDVHTLYRDLAGACAARSAVAEDKLKTTKKQAIENISSVAQNIADQVRPLLEMRQFPEDFISEGRPTQPINIERSGPTTIILEQLLSQVTITVSADTGNTLFHEQLRLVIGEVLVRALLMGRTSFPIPVDQNDAEGALTAFLASFGDVRRRISAAIDESAFGTGYEAQLTAEVFSSLGVHPLVGERALPHAISLGVALDSRAHRAVARRP